MLQVDRKEEESLESLIRRFNKKVSQSGVLTAARRKKFYEKPLTKREEREIAIRKRARKEMKTREALAIRG
jgi:small subunit ribosomal protein S21